MAVLEGVVQITRHGDGRVEITEAPPVTRITLELVAASDPVVFRVHGNLITLGDQVVYRVTGWDDHGKCLLAELVEDRRSR
jgi:hypothetical protein